MKTNRQVPTAPLALAEHAQPVASVAECGSHFCADRIIAGLFSDSVHEQSQFRVFI